MKKTALFALSALFCIGAQAQNKDLKVEISSDATVGGRFVFTIPTEKVSDTITVKKNGEKITYTHPFKEAGYVYYSYIKAGEDKVDGMTKASIFFEKPATIQVNGKIETLGYSTFNGGIYADENVKKVQSLSEKQYDIYAEYQKAPKEKKDSIRAEYDKISDQQKILNVAYIKANPDKVYSAALLSNMLRDSLSTIDPLYNAFSENVKASSYGKKISEKLERIRAIQVGMPAPDFTLKDIDGNELKLSDFRGKWVLLDFWGSWCIWCRRGNPGLVELYDKYGGKDFEILGIACRDKVENWKKAIVDDKLPWRHANVAQTEGADQLPNIYNVPGYPCKIMIDPEGKISVISIGYHEKDDPIALKLIEELGEVYVK
ncbi:MAG: TlpA disulfide reductase family protein [Flavobacteriales bacterium]|nr:TlpA disulfide reductase family protein [Flavobacteriales bacterium]